MKKSLITLSGLVLLMGTGVALAQWNKGEGAFPPFEEVDTNKDNMISMDEAKAHPGVVAAVTKGTDLTTHQFELGRVHKIASGA